MEHNQILYWVDEPREHINDESFFFGRDWGEKFVIYRVRWSCRIHAESYQFRLGFIYLCDGIDKTQTKVIRISVYPTIPPYPIDDKFLLLDLSQKRMMHHLLILSVYLPNLPPLSIRWHTQTTSLLNSVILILEKMLFVCFPRFYQSIFYSFVHF